MKIKKVSLILIILISVIFFQIPCLATDVNSVINSMNSINRISENLVGTTDGGMKGVLNIIIGILQLSGTGISIIMVSILGIKYILASPEEKAEIKKHAIPIVIGCALLFGAVNLIAALEEFSQSVVNQ